MNSFKAGIIIIILFVPAIFIVLSHLSGENYFYLPYFQESTKTFEQLEKPSESKQEMYRVNFTKSRNNNALIGFYIQNDEEYIKYFYPKITEIQSRFKGSDFPQVIIFASDTVDFESLQNMQDSFESIAQNWLIVKEKPENISKFVQELYIEPSKINPEFKWGVKKFALIDNEGFLRGQYKIEDRKELKRLKDEVNVLLNESEVKLEER